MTISGRKTHHVSWDDLRTALFLGRAGSIRKAARAAGISHSTVLRRIAALEAAVGVELFVDKGDGYEATPAGQDVFDTAATLDEAVTNLERRVSGHDLRLTGPVRVTVPDPLVPCVAPIFADFSKEQPGIEVTLALGAGFVDLAHRAADVAIRITDAPPPDLVGQRICAVNVGVYGTQAYLRGRSTKNLAALDWVSLERSSDMAFAKWLRAKYPGARVALQVSSPWGLREGVDAGAGIGLFPCALGEMMRHWRRLRLVPEISAPLWVLSHRDLRTTTRVRVLRDYVASALRAQRAMIEGKS